MTGDVSPAAAAGSIQGSDSQAGGLAGRRLPPVDVLAVVSVALMLIGGVYLAAHLPGHPGLAVPVASVAAGALLTAVDLALLSRVRPFAWPVFFLVFRWALVAYLVIAGLLGFVFVRDHTPAATLAVLVATLAVFAVDVPLILAFTVARYAGPPGLDQSHEDVNLRAVKPS
jgi:hypothetical protein